MDKLGGRARRTPAQVLFWRIFLINGSIFSCATLLLAVSPATVSTPVHKPEALVLAGGLVLLLGANALLVRASVSPLTALTIVMERVDLMRPGDRLARGRNRPLADLVDTFNAMLDRLEAERSASSAHALAAQEGERKRVAQELHDEIGQSLTVVLLALKGVVDRAPADLQKELNAVQENVRSSLDEVRRVAQRLRPSMLEDLGLLSALDALAEEFTQTSGVPIAGTPLASLNAEPPGLGAETELVVYRIAQESLTNVARHAQATRVNLSLTLTGDAVTLCITDDGNGSVLKEGAGIRGMRERALLIGARLTFAAPPRGGTKVQLVIPTTGRLRSPQ